ncbi:MAG: hypothetical protein KH347_04030 [Acetobacter sp.]|nr:hypothetical protein [Acetobacter sp.]
MGEHKSLQLPLTHSCVVGQLLSDEQVLNSDVFVPVPLEGEREESPYPSFTLFAIRKDSESFKNMEGCRDFATGAFNKNTAVRRMNDFFMMRPPKNFSIFFTVTHNCGKIMAKMNFLTKKMFLKLQRD